ncbi:MAG TPA: hypothetical protein VFD45_03380 [Patescibacteria group bacterium]|nr:hypothetical protein [Patescibacteria group bacterium]
MPKKIPSVNLVKPRHADFFANFINWALTIGRLVVIVTELIALSAFLYRFSLDRQLIDLHSKIKQEQTIVNYLKKEEDTYRNLQERLTAATTFSEISQDRVKLFNDVLLFTPQGLSFSEFTLNNDRLKIAADVESVSSLSNFVEELKKYPKIASISIDKIENRPAIGLIKVTISALIKEKKGNNDSN